MYMYIRVWLRVSPDHNPDPYIRV